MPTFTLVNNHHVRVYSYWCNGLEKQITGDDEVISFASERNRKFYVSSDIISKGLVSEKCSYLLAPEISWEEMEEMAKMLRLKGTLEWKSIIFSSPSSNEPRLCLRSSAGQLVIKYSMNIDWWEKFLLENGIAEHVYVTGDECVIFETG